MRVALVHDWLTGMRGGEKCLRAFLDLYPRADVYALLHVPGSTDARIDRQVRGTSMLQRLPGVGRYYRALLPLFPLAASSLKLNGYDLVISLSHAAAKNVAVGEGAVHLCYCFTPMRYIWDQAPYYFGRLLPAAWPLIRALRRWDVQGSERVDHFAGISSFVGARIRCYYGRHAEVVYPPVDTAGIVPAKPGTRGSHFLYAGALVPYKRADLVIAAFNRLRLPLLIAGGGPEEARLKSLAAPHIRFLGRVSDEELAALYRNCRALVFPGVEDFGLIPVECMAAGRPVIGLYAGGLKETIGGLKHWTNGRLAGSAATGVFIQRTSEGCLEALIEAVESFLKLEGAFEVEACIRRARLFSPARFAAAWNAALLGWGLPAASVSVVGAHAQEEKAAV